MILAGNGPVCPGLFWSVLKQAPNYHLIHINNLHYAHALTAFAAAKRRGLRIVLTPHIHVEQPVTYDVRYMRAMLEGSDHIIADTRAEREFLIDTGLDHQRVTTAGVGVRLEEFPTLDKRACRRELGLPDDAFVLFFLGRKTEYKGLDLLLEAFAALQQQYPRLHLLAVGRETAYSEALWARYSGLPRLIRHGNVPESTRLSALNACDCLVVPSSGEAFGIVYLEAWVVGKPVIALQTQATSSLIDDGKDGYLVPPRSLARIVERIVCLLKDPDQAQQMGEQGRTKVLNRYTVSRIVDITESVYLRVLRRKQRYTYEKQLN
jgi:glycosyltransferase involved in cell wall biosynthesis